ncbi:response regulator [Microvirga makkahensis]|uniref:Response regulator n=1 Tax=Microvirga makkahensis TaxID=1128670 RepID=A0A7X3MWB8_9HYPH|nr:response regulator [Microvirga makkahensis]MXQ14140.1 response regulator [Microvirga makkahensis]
MTSTAETGALTYRRVLIVEDEYFLADDMAQALRKFGADVVGPVRSTDEALALLAEEPVDAAVLDINLKGQMVYPVADALREQGVPFIFATGYDEAAVPEAYRGVPRWEKPFRPEDLAKALPGLVQKS